MKKARFFFGLAVLCGIQPACAEPPPPPAIERLAMWCEFLPYGDILPCLPVLARYRCDLILHVERESLEDPSLPALLRAAEQAGVGVDAWLLLPYDEHLYVGQASMAATRRLALEAADYFTREGLAVRSFVFDCEPSPLLGRELFAACLTLSPRQLVRILKEQLDPDEFQRDVQALNELIAALRGKGYGVDGAANRAFLDAQQRGNVALEDALNAPVSGIGWDALSFITYRYQVSQESYVGMLNRYATLAKRFYGPRAAMDVGLIGDYADIPQNAERAALFGGGDLFYNYLYGMRDTRDLEQAVGTVLGCGVRRINLYALDGAVTSVAGLESWLKAARRARPHSFWKRWTPAASLQYGLLGALTEKGFRWCTGASRKTHGEIYVEEP
ncbi:MAG: hypothetical protein LBN38_02800 [Verrucomicrobiota bacterium]|jgi:hypothetical protein|nr:hypothetical protein [Verrucomicrobiota bacterium]